MKRTITALLAALLLLTLVPGAALADFDPESISTPHICLMDRETGAVLYERDAHEKAYPASTTKIMTTILAIEMCDDLYEVINIGNQFDTSGSATTPPLSRNEELRIIDLLYCIMLVSGNDAASALAIHLAGSQEQFAVLMNQKAAEIGMNDTHFTNANGLHDESHYSSAYDMALLGRYAMRNEAFRKIVSTKTFEVPATNKNGARSLETSNRLIFTKADKENFEYAYATGIKTGDTKYAGRCLLASAQKDGVELVIALLGDIEGQVPTEYRFENASKFFDWGFANYTSVQVAQLNLPLEFSAPVSNASFAEETGGVLAVQANIEPDAAIAGFAEKINAIKSNPSSITASQTYTNGTITAPINAGDMVGQVAYSYEGEVIFTADLIAQRSIDEIGNVVDVDPSASPLLMDDEKPKGNPFLVWFIILGCVLILFVVIKLAVNSRYRRRHRRRTAYRYKGRR
ncbi:MAG: D-alanyl-D-alanine carboxypeptidase family protein [Candidatus Pelethousia sp.]|nr:D-alanyl-D-alanine carboxypeptidase family protein [Candidatus Pelethousia sp.]